MRITTALATTTVVVALALSSATAASATSRTPAEPGAAVGSVAIEPGSSPTTVTEAEGGARTYVPTSKWSYGTTGPNGGGRVYSNYWHLEKKHASSVRNAHGRTASSNVAAPGKWSNASTTAIAHAVDHAFYRIVN
jgi:lactococcin 972 family bacteriocin